MPKVDLSQFKILDAAVIKRLLETRAKDAAELFADDGGEQEHGQTLSEFLEDDGRTVLMDWLEGLAEDLENDADLFPAFAKSLDVIY